MSTASRRPTSTPPSPSARSTRPSSACPGGEEDLDDLSPAGNAAAAELRRTTLAQLAAATPTDDVDRVTVDAMTERLQLAEDRYAAGLDEMSLNVLASPLQGVRDVFDLMPQDTEERLAHLRRRAWRKIPAALEGYQESLLARPRARAGLAAPPGRGLRRAVARPHRRRRLLRQDRRRRHGRRRPLDGEPRTALAAAAKAASAAYGDIADWLERELLPHAPEADACGRERYALESRYFLGATVDLEETYRWGQQEVASLARPDERDRRGARGRRERRARRRDPRRRREVPAARHRRAQGLDAGARRRGHRRPQGRALRHPRAGAAHRVHDRADADRRHLLHRPVRRLQPTRAGCGGRCPRATPSSARGTS